MRLVSGSEPDFHLVATVGFCVLQKQIEPSSFRMRPFAILKYQVTQAQYRRIIGDSALKPFQKLNPQKVD